VRDLFTASFLEAIPVEKLFGVIAQTTAKLGACGQPKPLRSLGANAAVVRLTCEHGTAELTLYVDAQPPNKVAGFMIKPE